MARETLDNIEQERGAARSGVFADDWDFNGGPYNLVAVPATAVMVEIRVRAKRAAPLR